MRTLVTGQSVAVRYKDQDFVQIMSGVRQESIVTEGILLAFVGIPKLQMEMAARELAATLGKPLYHVDLKSISNKYIGETEKNLQIQFERAAAARSILFFDEADALFGNRPNVQDGHDRYGNTETNYLLDRLSKYRGIAIALFKSRSEAERRRNRLRQLVVTFPPP